MKWLIIIIGVMMVIGAGAGALMNGLSDVRTDNISQEFRVSTVIGGDNATVQLSDSLWRGSLSRIQSISSNNTSDAPVASSYNATSRALLVIGLSENVTRTLTVSYLTGALEDYPGAEEGITFVPSPLILSLIIISILCVVGMIVTVIKVRRR